MKKMIKMAACGLVAAMLVTGCSKEAEKTETGATGAAAETVEETIVEMVPDGQESIELGAYKGLEYTSVGYEITEEDVEMEVQALLDAHPVIVEVKRPAAEGDVVNIDYVGKKDGVAFEGGTAQGYDLKLGSNSFIDGFEDGLIGAEAGQTVNLDLTFPEVYHSAELAGQAVVFEVTVNSIKEHIPATLSNSFVAQYTQYTTVEEYRTGLKEELQAYMDSMSENQMKSELWTQILDTTKVTVSQSAVEEYAKELYDGYVKEAERNSMDIETYISYYGVDLESFKKDMNVMAQGELKTASICRAIADAEGLVITDEDRQELAEQTGYESVEAMIEMNGEFMVDNYILSEKVIQFVVENAVAVTAE